MADLLRNRNLQKLNIYMNDFEDEDNLSIKSGVTISSDENDDGDNEAYHDLKRTLYNNKNIDFKDRLLKIKYLLETDNKQQNENNQAISKGYYSKLLAKRVYDMKQNINKPLIINKQQPKQNFKSIINNIYPIRTNNQTLYSQETMNFINKKNSKYI